MKNRRSWRLDKIDFWLPSQQFGWHKVQCDQNLSSSSREISVRYSVNFQTRILILALFQRFDNEERQEFVVETESKENDGVTDVTISTNVMRNEIRDESPVSCEVSIPQSDYTKKETKIYDGMR